MSATQVECSSPVRFPYRNLTGLGCDDRNFLFVDGSVPRILKFDSRFRFMEAVHMARVYTGICYDFRENCYWAMAEKKGFWLCRLDAFLRETKQIPIRSTGNGKTCGLSYDRETDGIWFTFPGAIGYCEKKLFPSDSSKSTYLPLTYLQNRDLEVRNTGVLSLPSCLLVAGTRDGNETIKVRRLGRCGRPLSVNVPEGYTVRGMCAAPGSAQQSDSWLLLQKADTEERAMMKLQLRSDS